MASNRNLRWEEIDKSQTDLSVLLQHFEVHNKTEGKSPRTVGWYNEVLGMFIRWLREDGSSTAIGDIDEYTVRRFILYVQEKPLSRHVQWWDLTRSCCRFRTGFELKKSLARISGNTPSLAGYSTQGALCSER